jgi:hypothetical protein
LWPPAYIFSGCTPVRAALSKPHETLLQLAAVREEVFEQALVESGAAPSASGIIARHDAVTRPPVAAMDSHKALWLGGRLFDFDREGALDEDPNELLASRSGRAVHLSLL